MCLVDSFPISISYQDRFLAVGRQTQCLRPQTVPFDAGGALHSPVDTGPLGPPADALPFLNSIQDRACNGNTTPFRIMAEQSAPRRKLLQRIALWRCEMETASRRQSAATRAWGPIGGAEIFSKVPRQAPL
jgi:hypothetical protein